MNILAFGASASAHSINKRLAHYTAKQFDGHTLAMIDLIDYSLPLYTIDLERASGIPQTANEFLEKVNRADLIIISLAEHNGSYTAWFKNLFDWTTRINGKFLENKKVFLLSTSPGARGGLSVMGHALDRFPRHGAVIIGSFSLPNFNENFSLDKGVMHEQLALEYRSTLDQVKTLIAQP